MKKIVAAAFCILLLAGGCKKDTTMPYVGAWDWSPLVLQLNSNNTYVITKSDTTYETGKYTANSTQFSFTANSGPCSADEVGTYSYVIGASSITSGSGYYATTTSIPTLTIAQVSDSCSWRSTNLPGPYLKQ